MLKLIFLHILAHSTCRYTAELLSDKKTELSCEKVIHSADSNIKRLSCIGCAIVLHRALICFGKHYQFLPLYLKIRIHKVLEV
jgi:hypothetical protein